MEITELQDLKTILSALDNYKSELHGVITKDYFQNMSESLQTSMKEKFERTNRLISQIEKEIHVVANKVNQPIDKNADG